jgi:uncharacterized protein (TIGR02598 family)
MKITWCKTHAFSLVEVVVALGLFSFCIVAITGLLSVGLGSTRSVVNEGVAANIAGSVYGAWGAQTNGAVALTVPGLFTSLPALSTSASNSFFFDQSGVQTANSAGAALQMGYVVTADGVAPAVNSKLDLIFSWPVGGATNVLQTRRYSRVFVK